MKIYIGADHRGFTLKKRIKKTLEAAGNEVVDVEAKSHATIAQVSTAIRQLAREKKFVTFDSISEALAQ